MIIIDLNWIIFIICPLHKLSNYRFLFRSFQEGSLRYGVQEEIKVNYAATYLSICHDNNSSRTGFNPVFGVHVVRWNFSVRYVQQVARTCSIHFTWYISIILHDYLIFDTITDHIMILISWWINNILELWLKNKERETLITFSFNFSYPKSCVNYERGLLLVERDR